MLLVLSICPFVKANDAWPEWRGPSGQGVSDAKNVPITWSERENIAWKTPVTGRGWSTPVIANGRIWLTNAIDTPCTPEERERRRKASSNSMPMLFSASVSLRAIEVDLETGKVLRDIELLQRSNPQGIHADNSYATPTPVVEGDRLYCYFGPNGCACLDIPSGTVIWTNLDTDVQLENGPGSSPALFQDRLVMHCDGIDQQFVIAMDKKTGKTLWKTKRSGEMNANPQLQKSYATPLITEVNGQTLVVSPAADWLYGYDPADGKEVWKVPYGGLGFSNSARPVSAHGLLFTCTGFMKGELLALRIDSETSNEPSIEWRHGKQVPNVSSPVIVGNEIYFASDNGVASCLDAKTGEVYWTQRIGKKYWVSPVAAEDRIYFFDQSGKTTVIAASRQFEKLAENQLDGQFFASAAVIDGALLLRTDKALYRIQ